MRSRVGIYIVCAILSAGTVLWTSGRIPVGHGGVRLGQAWSSVGPNHDPVVSSTFPIVHLPLLSGTITAGTIQDRRAFLQAINADREKAGLQPLRLMRSLSVVALAHSLDMAHYSYLSHGSRAGLSPFDRLHAAGIVYLEAGENIGYDQGSDTAVMVAQIEDAMMHSPEHRANLLRPEFTRVGIGVARVGGMLIVTEDFILRRST